jgi:hypothetical protein
MCAFYVDAMFWYLMGRALDLDAWLALLGEILVGVGCV